MPLIGCVYRISALYLRKLVTISGYHIKHKIDQRSTDTFLYLTSSLRYNMKFSFTIFSIVILFPCNLAEQKCRFKTDPNNPSGYIERTQDGRNFSRRCAPGTVYSKDICGCIVDANASGRRDALRRCSPSLHYNFKNDTNDKSIFALPSYAVKVKISENETAVFTPNSRITIWRFANAEFRQGLYISFSIMSHTQPSDPQIIFTNDKGSDTDDPSIFARVEGDKYMFKLQTSARQETIKIDKSPGFNNITVKYDGNSFRVTCNDKVISRHLTGVIHKRYTPLTIGGFNGNSFTGELEYFKLFMCIPKYAQ
ncbi:protein PIF-like [Argonauta hians]